jgi:hypothetical protein
MPLPPLPVYSRYVLVTLALLCLALLIVKLAPVLLLVFAGIVFASAIRSASTPLARRTGLSDGISVGIVRRWSRSCSSAACISSAAR